MASLRDRFLHPQNFELAWDKVASNQGCAGVDGKTIHAFGYKNSVSCRNYCCGWPRGAIAQCRYGSCSSQKKSGGWRELGVSHGR